MGGPSSPEADLEWALEAARLGAAAAREHFGTDLEVRGKGRHDEPVSEGDLAANQAILDHLAACDPRTPVVSEEVAFDEELLTRADRLWVVDPIDGTREYIQGHEDWAVQVGLLVQGEPVLGVLDAPALDKVWRGGKHFPAARRDGGSGRWHRIQVGVETELTRFRLAHSSANPTGLVLSMREALGIRRTFRRGAAGIKCMLVAEGQADLYLLPGRVSKIWDLCAPEAIVVAAGGMVTDFEGRPLAYRGPGVGNRCGVVVSSAVRHGPVLARVGPLRRARYGEQGGGASAI